MGSGTARLRSASYIGLVAVTVPRDGRPDGTGAAVKALPLPVGLGPVVLGGLGGQ